MLTNLFSQCGCQDRTTAIHVGSGEMHEPAGSIQNLMLDEDKFYFCTRWSLPNARMSRDCF